MTEKLTNFETAGIPSEQVAEVSGQLALTGVAGGEAGRFAHLFDPNNDPNEGLSEQQIVDRAAMHPPAGELPPERTSDREGYWKPPTDAQIARDPDLAGQNKYYPSRG